MPSFYLDDESIEFEPGESVLNAALRHGQEIPHYCYHPGMSVVATCRMSLVEITDLGNGKGLPKLQASCATAAAEGMKISTTTEKVVTALHEVNEYLLVNHPLDCSICDQAGECKLQDFAFSYGTGHSEMEYEKRVYGWRDVGTYIMLERNRCIHCSRCERFSREVEGGHDFGMFLRSHEVAFDTFEDHRITHPFQGNLVDLCPVGAITEREFRFKKRAWKLKKTNSICPSCATGCNITVEHHRNKVERLKPRENQAVNRWWMCDIGRLGYRELNDRDNRPLEPLARVKGQLRSAGWEAVYQAMAQRAKEIGAEGEQAVGLIDGQASNEELHLFGKLLSECFGSGTVLFPAPPKREAKGNGFLQSLISADKSANSQGAMAMGFEAADAEKAQKAVSAAKVLWVFGSPFAEDGAIREAARKAELIVHVGTANGAWRDVADVVLPGLTYAEKAGTFTNGDRRVQRFQPAVRGPENAREQIRILAESMAALGKPQAAGSAGEVLAAMGGAFQGLTWETVGDLGAPLGEAG